MSIEIRRIQLSDEAEVRAADAVIAAETPAFLFAPGLADAASFADWLSREDAIERGQQLPPGFVPATRRLAIVDGRVAGAVSIRHLLNPFLLRLAGHIGFGVLAPFRRRGVATALLQHALVVLAEQGWDRALITCDATNQGSRRTILACGGRVEEQLDTTGLGGPFGAATERWWVPLEGRPTRPGG